MTIDSMDNRVLNHPHGICIVTGSLVVPGGAERIACWLANAWSCRGIRVTVITLGPNGKSFFGLEPSIEIRPLGYEPQGRSFFRSAFRCLQLTWNLRKVLRENRPDCVISFVDVNGILTLLASRGLKTKVIVSERTDPHGRRLPYKWELLRRLTYSWADCLVTQSEHALNFFPPQLRLRGRVIPNPVLPSNGAMVELRKTEPGKPHRILMGLGSLRPVKGFDRLIEAFATNASKHPEWSLVIYGEGNCRPELEHQIRQLGLAHRIALPGVTRNPHDRLREADMFVLSSRNEGFPNALAEAMACGLPVISFDCKSGPRELIRDGIDGVLVADNDVVALAEQVDRLMGDQAERDGLARRAPEVLERFSSERVLAMWRDAVQASVAQAIRPHRRLPNWFRKLVRPTEIHP